MNVLITGGSGFLGGALSRDLTDAGHSVRILSRSARLPSSHPARVTLVHCPNPSEEITPEQVSGVDAIINLAGESLGAGRWSTTRKDRMFKSRVGTTQNLVNAISQLETKPNVLVTASAVGYYGPHGDEPLTEADQAGSDFQGTLCSHWEDEAKKVIRSGVRLTILRFGVVLGAGAEALKRMMMPFRLFVGGPVGSGRQVLSWIHLHDVIGLIRLALESDAVSGPINATSPNAVTNREFAAALGRAMGRPAFFPTPGFMLRVILGEMADLVLKGQRVIPKRALEYGYQFQYPEIDSALRQIVKGG